MLKARKVLNAELPPGSIWAVEDDGDLDKLFDGIAESDESYKEFLSSLAKLRDPFLTPILDGLEEEYGLLQGGLSESVRRERLSAAITAGSGDGTAEFLQVQLRKAGFDIYVHINDPAVDPQLFVFNGASTICGNQNAIFGRSDAYFGGITSGLVVNGDAQDVNYAVPADSNRWPMVFFVGGEATRDGGTGELTDIQPATVDVARKDELTATIVKHKPLGTWAGLSVIYVQGE